LRLLKTLRKGFTLMVSLPKNCPDLARAAVEAGAECLKVHINCHHFASDTRFGNWHEEKVVISEIKDACGKIPLGLVSGEQTQPGRADLDEIEEFGFDFWDLFCRFTPPEFLDLPNMGRMVAIDSSWEPWLIKALADLHVDVIESSIIPRDNYRGELNLEDVARYHRLAQCSTMPILIPTQKAIKPEQVRYLKRAGAAGITIGAVVTGLEPKSLKEATSAFRWAIDDMSSGR
jgi:hypothetical protein